MLVFKIMYLTSFRVKNCSQDFKKAPDQLTIGLECSPPTYRTVLNPSAIMAV